MSTEQNLSIVRQGYEAFGRGDIPALLNLLDEQITWVTPGPADLPTCGTRKGRAAVSEFFQTLVSMADVVRFEPKTFATQGDLVIVLGDETCRVKPTGRAVDLRWAHVFTIGGGKITAFEEIGDFSAISAERRSAGVGA
jgi:ketosteroid isomerase-like protein